MKTHVKVVAVAATIFVLSGCTSTSVPTEWSDAYGALGMELLNSRDQAVVDCLADKGFPGYSVVWNGGVESPPLTTEQLEPARQATKDCISQTAGSESGQPSQEALGELYKLEVAASECLARIGLVASAPVPSVQKYVESYGSDDHWSAFSAVADQITSDSELRTVARECPDPNWFLGLN